MGKKIFRVVSVLSATEGSALDREAQKAGLSRSAFVRHLIRLAADLGPDTEEVLKVTHWQDRKDRRVFPGGEA